MAPDASDCRALWRAVILQGARDLVSPVPLHAHEARLWIGSRHFRAVCELAGVHPEQTARRLLSPDIKICVKMLDRRKPAGARTGSVPA